MTHRLSAAEYQRLKRLMTYDHWSDEQRRIIAGYMPEALAWIDSVRPLLLNLLSMYDLLPGTEHREWEQEALDLLETFNEPDEREEQIP